MTQNIALVALALFAILMVVVGIYSARRSKTMDSFLLGKRKIGAWMSAFAYGTSYFSAVIFVGYAGKHGWDIGMAGMWIGVGNALFGCFLAWKLMAKRTRSMTRALSSRTMPEFFGSRYLDPKLKVFAAIVIFLFLVPYAASVYKGLGMMFSFIFPGLDGAVFGMSASSLCMLIVALLTAVYLILGGYLASAITDFIQGIIMVGGVLLLAAAMLAQPQVGGISGLVSGLQSLSTPDHQLTSVSGGSNFFFLLINIALTSFGTWGLPQMVHKFYAVRDDKAIRHGMIISTVFALIIGVCAYLVGSMGRLMLGNTLPEGGFDAVIPNMLMSAFSSSFLGSILLAVILLLLLSASMSTLSAVVLSSASAISVDLVGMRKKKLADKNQMTLTRILCFVFIGLSFIFASFNFSFIVSIMSYSWGVVSGCFIGPFLWGLFKKSITRAGAWAGMLGGLVTVVTMALVSTLSSPLLSSDGFYAAFQEASKNSPTFGVTAMAVSIVIVPLVSLLTKKLPEAHVAKAFSKPEEAEA